MLEKIDKIKAEVIEYGSLIKDKITLEEFRLKFLSRKGLLNDLFEDFKLVDKSLKGAVGKALNELKILSQNVFEEKQKVSRTYRLNF